jgi:hypothetical protein
MKLAGAWAVLAAFGGAAGAQNAVADWFPLRAGGTWTYEHETRDQTGVGVQNIEVHRWTTEETITGAWTIAEGTLVGRYIRIVEGAPRFGDRVPPEPAFLIRGDCLYRLGANDWDPSAHQLAGEFLKWLNLGEWSPDFCFPLALRATWGAPNWGRTRPASEAKDWEVDRIETGASPAPGNPPTFHIASISPYLGSGMTGDIWFEKGVGIVREELIHHGTIGENRTQLVRFDPAP